MRKASVNEVRGSGDADIDEIVWQKWMKGWLVGPLDEEQVPVDRPLSRRFGLSQVWGKCAVRTFDLASAYRQVGLKASGLPISGFTTPGRRRHVFRSLVLPFGAIRSVHSFLRLARALWWQGVVGCCILWTSSYDDFIAFSRPKLVGSTEKSVTALFKLLGWIFAEEGEKAQPFDLHCTAL